MTRVQNLRGKASGVTGGTYDPATETVRIAAFQGQAVIALSFK